MLQIQIPGKATKRNLRTLPVQGDLHGQRLQKFQNTKCTNHRYMTNVFHSYKRSWELQQDAQQFSMESIQDKCVEISNVDVFISGSSHSSLTEYFGEPGGLQEHELRGKSDLV